MRKQYEAYRDLSTEYGKEDLDVAVRSRNTKNVDTSRRERVSFVLNNEEILQLGRWAVEIEEHYKKPMDMEWAKDGETGDFFILQARPETASPPHPCSVFLSHFSPFRYSISMP